MRTAIVLIFTAAATLSIGAAQEFEAGGLAGAGLASGVNVTAPAGAATTGFRPGGLFGGFLGHNSRPHLGGEVRYSFLQSNLKLDAGGQGVTFGGVSHVVHYDLLLHTSKLGSPVRPFVAFGGGMRLFRGTGQETAYQPLSEFAYLTRTSELKPLISVGAGVKFQLSRNLYLRTEFRDYITPFPNQVIAPGRGAKVSGMLHNIVPMAGISFGF